MIFCLAILGYYINNIEIFLQMNREMNMCTYNMSGGLKHNAA